MKRSRKKGRSLHENHHQAKAFAGMTLTEYADFITRFLVHEADGFDGLADQNRDVIHRGSG